MSHAQTSNLRRYELHEGEVAELVCLQCATEILNERGIKHKLPLNYVSDAITIIEDVFGEHEDIGCSFCQARSENK